MVTDSPKTDLRCAIQTSKTEIGRYIVDFYSVEAKLVIELDGSQHFEPDAIAYDLERTEFLESQGLKVIRFDNLQVFNELESVLAVIYEEVKVRI